MTQILSDLREYLEQSQWQSPRHILGVQHERLAQLVAHTYKTVPWYRQQWSSAGIDIDRFDPRDDWRRLPIVQRRDIQKAAGAMRSTSLPPEHGGTHEKATGGSTGRPLKVLCSGLTNVWFLGLTLRDHLWHDRDLSRTLGVIRYSTDPGWQPPDGVVSPNWGPATTVAGVTGPAAALSIMTTTEQQQRWMQSHDVGYLLTYPSVLLALAERSIEDDVRYPNLLQVRTFGEILEPQVRAVCGEAWGIRVVDLYSSEEVGYIALQCPTGEHYHVQSESLFVEVIDEEGELCGPGQIGRVVLTTLHNYAMPLVRYDIGDYAEVGEACGCGRGLPVLNKIMGRQRNMFILPSGGKLWPSFVVCKNESPLPTHQFQVVQKTIDRVELRLVVEARLTPAQEEQAVQRLRRGMGEEFEYTIAYVDHIPRSPRGKYQDFVCEVEGPAGPMH